MESERENTDNIALDIINNEFGLRDLCIDNIQRSHRLGPRKKPTNQRNLRSIATTTKPRPIIIRFASYRDRQKVFLAKSNLKGKKMMISENLTKRRYSILQAAITKYGKGKVWTIDGRITTKVNDHFITMNSIEDI